MASGRPDRPVAANRGEPERSSSIEWKHRDAGVHRPHVPIPQFVIARFDRLDEELAERQRQEIVATLDHPSPQLHHRLGSGARSFKIQVHEQVSCPRTPGSCPALTEASRRRHRPLRLSRAPRRVPAAPEWGRAASRRLWPRTPCDTSRSAGDTSAGAGLFAKLPAPAVRVARIAGLEETPPAASGCEQQPPPPSRSRFD